ncbi:MAG: polysaccharide pyruvyl transferase family protein [Smithella sp.]
MKILIIEAYSADNIGSGALVENSLRLLQKNFPCADIEILAQTPESIHELTGFPCHHELITFPLGQSRIKQIFWLMTTSLWMLVHALSIVLKRVGIAIPVSLYTYNSRRRTAVRKIREADMVVSVGAERINDNFYKAIIFSLYMLWIVKSYGKFLVLFPQTIGPFHFRLTRLLSAKVLSRCDVIFLRDRKSFDIIKETGVRGPVIINTCDVAVLQPAVKREIARDLLRQAGVPDDERPLIGISAMQWNYIKARGESRYEEYIKAIAAIADEFIKEKGVRILFIATNVFTERYIKDDVTAARDIIELMQHKDRATILDTVYTPSQMKGIMGLFELCLVTRMHACILSTGIFTPAASINYQFKLKEYMNLIGLGEYTVDIDVITTAKLRTLMENAWNDRDACREVLVKSITSLSTELEEVMSELPEYFFDKDERGLLVRSKLSPGEN